ncbi:MAG: hypothetical protein ACI9TY_001560 [Alphaproteobacteria bacterium]|jgi:hypothetical protein
MPYTSQNSIYQVTITTNKTSLAFCIATFSQYLLHKDKDPYT